MYLSKRNVGLLSSDPTLYCAEENYATFNTNSTTSSSTASSSSTSHVFLPVLPPDDVSHPSPISHSLLIPSIQTRTRSVAQTGQTNKNNTTQYNTNNNNTTNPFPSSSLVTSNPPSPHSSCSSVIEYPSAYSLVGGDGHIGGLDWDEQHEDAASIPSFKENSAASSHVNRSGDSSIPPSNPPVDSAAVAPAFPSMGQVDQITASHDNYNQISKPKDSTSSSFSLSHFPAYRSVASMPASAHSMSVGAAFADFLTNSKTKAQSPGYTAYVQAIANANASKAGKDKVISSPALGLSMSSSSITSTGLAVKNYSVLHNTTTTNNNNSNNENSKISNISQGQHTSAVSSTSNSSTLSTAPSSNSTSLLPTSPLSPPLPPRTHFRQHRYSLNHGDSTSLVSDNSNPPTSSSLSTSVDSVFDIHLSTFTLSMEIHGMATLYLLIYFTLHMFIAAIWACTLPIAVYYVGNKWITESHSVSPLLSSVSSTFPLVPSSSSAPADDDVTNLPSELDGVMLTRQRSLSIRRSISQHKIQQQDISIQKTENTQ